MASKTSTVQRRRAETFQDHLPVQVHQQLAHFTKNTAFLYKGVEAVHQVHQQAVQRSALRMQQAAEQLRSSDSAAEWLSIQSTLALSGYQEWTQYLQELTKTLLSMQSNSVSQGSAAHTLDAEPSGTEALVVRSLNPASVAADATSTATLAVLKSWSNLLGAGVSTEDKRSSH